MRRLLVKIPVLFGLLAALTGCQRNPIQSDSRLPSALNEIQSVRLNYRYEADVPPPAEAEKTSGDQRNAAIQSDFDQNRPQELLDKTVASPDGKRVLAVYHRVADMQSEFRLDMYSPDGRLLKKVTADIMAVHFPDTIRWSPDSAHVAFVAMLRGPQIETGDAAPNGFQPPANTAANSDSIPANVESNVNPNANDVNTDADANAAVASPTPPAPAGILTFRTEQIYLCDAEGDGTKPVTQNEGLIYFYYVWAPDSSMLAALAATEREWDYLEYRANEKKKFSCRSAGRGLWRKRAANAGSMML